MDMKLLLVIGVMVSVVFSLPYGKDSPVISLNKNNFAKEVFGSEHVWLIEFYAPWCGHCKNLAPEYEKLAKNLKGIVKIGAVDGDSERELSQQYGIQGFPTLKVFPSKIKKTKDGFSKTPTDYNGQRTAAAMSEFVLSQLPNFVTSISSKNKEEFFKKNETAKAILFTNKKEVTHLFKALAIDYHYEIAFGAIKDTEKELVEEYKITKFPTLIVIPKEGAEPITYSGELKHAALLDFFKPYAPGKPQQESEPKKEKKEEKPKRNIREEVKDQESFESVCYNKAASCLVAVLDPENSGPESHENYLKTLEKVDQKYGDKFITVWIDGLKNYDWADKFNLASGFPNIMVLNPKKLAMVSYRGSFNEASVNEFLQEILDGKAKPYSIKEVHKLKLKDEL